MNRSSFLFPRHLSVAVVSALMALSFTQAAAAAPASPAQVDQPAVPDYGAAPSGFYQIVSHGGEVFAAFGGTLENFMLDPVTQPAGTVPGAVFVFDADTLALKQEIPLQAIGGALALNPAKNQLIVGHTHNHAISTVDLNTRRARYHVLDTRHDGTDYRMRYVATDSAGDVYVSAFDWRVPFRHAVFKFDADGRAVSDFRVQSFEGFAIPLSITRQFSGDGREQVLWGSPTLRLANTRSGAIEYTAATPLRGGPDEQTNLYNYVPGPGNTLIATNAPHFMDGNQGDYNLYLFEKGQEHRPQKRFTAATALEALYNPDAGQLYASSYGNQLLSIVALDEQTPLDRARFENLRFKAGIPSNIAMRRTAQGTELFVTLRTSANRVAKVRIDSAVKGIEGLRAPGACQVLVWDLDARSVSGPEACDFVDVEAQLRDNLAGAKAFAEKAPQQLAEAEKALQDSQAALAEAERASRAQPDDVAARQGLHMAQFTVTMNAFMLDVTRRAGQAADHVVNGAQGFLDAYRAAR